MRRCRRGTRERESERGDPVLDGTFLKGVNAPKRRWHEPSAQQKGILPAYRWTSSAIETAVPAAESRNPPAASAWSELVEGRRSADLRAADAGLVQRRKEAPPGGRCCDRPKSLRRMPTAKKGSVAFSARLGCQCEEAKSRS